MSTQKTRLVLMASLLAASLVGLPFPARAHRDALDGPVVKAARLALEKRDATSTRSRSTSPAPWTRASASDSCPPTTPHGSRGRASA